MNADKNKDIILYKLGTTIGTDKSEVRKNQMLNDHYANTYTPESELIARVVNPAKVLKDIRAKLTKEELYILSIYKLA
jgi:hypothetical protein